MGNTTQEAEKEGKGGNEGARRESRIVKIPPKRQRKEGKGGNEGVKRGNGAVKVPPKRRERVG